MPYKEESKGIFFTTADGQKINLKEIEAIRVEDEDPNLYNMFDIDDFEMSLMVSEESANALLEMSKPAERLRGKIEKAFKEYFEEVKKCPLL